MNSNNQITPFLSSILISHAFLPGSSRSAVMQECALPVTDSACQIRGRAVGIISSTWPTIVLLAEESKMGSMVLSQDASDQFQAAVRRLEETGEGFYTSLHLDCATSVFFWRRELLTGGIG